MTLCLSAMRLHLQQSQSLNLQCRLCPLSHEMTPWLRQRAHLGLRPPASGSEEAQSSDDDDDEGISIENARLIL